MLAQLFSEKLQKFNAFTEEKGFTNLMLTSINWMFHVDMLRLLRHL